MGEDGQQSVIAQQNWPAGALESGPASSVQEQLWFLARLEPDSCRYNILLGLRLRGPLDTEALHQAFLAIIRRHKALRTTFSEAGGAPVQVVSPIADAELSLTDLSALPAAERDRLVQDAMDAEWKTPFDLSTGPLIRVKLLRTSARDHVLLVTVHHIVFDGASVDILMAELRTGYECYASARQPDWAGLPAQYLDYARGQRARSSAADVAYWQGALEGSKLVLDLPTDRPLPPVRSQRGGVERLNLDRELTCRVTGFCRREGLTVSGLFLAVYAIVLGRHCAQDDIIIGTALLNRPSAQLEGVIGLFANTVPLRVDLSGAPTARAVLDHVQDVLFDALEHESVPFEQVVQAVRPSRDLNYSPIFRVMFGATNDTSLDSVQLAGLEVTNLRPRRTVAQYDLSLDVRYGGDQIWADLEYAGDIFDQPTVARMIGHLRQVLTAVIDDSGQLVQDIDLLTTPERRELLYGRNATDAPVPQQCIHELFAEQAARSPDAIAVVAGQERITYRSLETRATQMAGALRALGVGTEDRVAVCLDSAAPEAVVAALAVLKAGGVFVPLDPDYPAWRLELMLTEARAAVLVTSRSLAKRQPARDGTRVLWIDEGGLDPRPGPEAFTTVENLACMLFTSGSTGRPKCVMLTHQNLLNYYCFFNERYSLSSILRVHLQTATYSFDQYLASLMRSLLTGATLLLCPRDVLLSPADVYRLIRQENVNSAEFAPAHLKMILDYLEQSGQSLEFMDLIAAGGDNWQVSDYLRAGRLASAGTRLIDTYGPTETAIDSAHFTGSLDRYLDSRGLGPESIVPIGHPVWNTQLYILDPRMTPVPVGVSGELYIGGHGVGRGYFGRPGTTAERFVPDPFSRAPGRRLYKTGDLTRAWPDGTIEILGRLDDQVQIRGFRVEPGEVEQMLRAHELVADAAVVAHEKTPGDRYLIAYVALSAAGPAAPPPTGQARASIEEHLRMRLPHYMVPAALVILDQLPLNPNGKLDRRALPDPGAALTGAARARGRLRTWTEDVIAEVWREVVGLDRLGADENFFEIGGHSLLATRILARLRSILGIDVPVRAIFEKPTVAGLAEYIAGRAAVTSTLSELPLTPAPRGDPEASYQVSFPQERMWFISRFDPGNTAYNVSEPTLIRGRLDVAALRCALESLVARHEVLRTRYVSVRGVPRQVIDAAGAWPLPLVDLSARDAGQREAEAARLVQEDVSVPFDLATGPLLKTMLVRLTPTEHLFLVTMHHIVTDGWSLGIFWEELGALYSAAVRSAEAALPELTLKYADFAEWQRAAFGGGLLQPHLDYWRQVLDGAPPVINLPLDHPRSAITTARAGGVDIHVPTETVARLQQVAIAEGATLFMVLLAAFSLLLGRLTGDDDIVSGFPTAGRTAPGLESVMGCFINTLVLRTDLSGDPECRELVGRVRSAALDAYAHQDLPFERLVQAMRPARGLHHNPIIQVLLALDNNPETHAEFADLEVTPVPFTEPDTQFDLSLLLEEKSAGLEGVIRYKADLFEQHTIAAIAEAWHALLASIAADPGRRLSELTLPPCSLNPLPARLTSRQEP
jgi:amino acid adenylation domain-containing protein